MLTTTINKKYQDGRIEYFIEGEDSINYFMNVNTIYLVLIIGRSSVGLRSKLRKDYQFCRMNSWM